MAQLTLTTVSNSLISQRLQASTEKAILLRINRFNFNHWSYSAEQTYIHPKAHTQTSIHGIGQSPKADFSDNRTGA